MPAHRTLAIGDVHGCATALRTALAAADPQRDDLIVPVGDYVDRGPDSAGVIATLLHLGRRCHLIPVRGNHDQMMLDARGDPRGRAAWLAVGGDATLASYGGSIADVPADHWAFLAGTCVDSVETATHLFVHGGLVPGLPLERHTRFQLQWQPFPPAEPHGVGNVIVCGHTALPDGLPRSVGHAVCVDTNVDRPGGWLTILDVRSGQYWQANEAGDVRTASLEVRP